MWTQTGENTMFIKPPKVISALSGILIGMTVATAAWSSSTLEEVMKERGLTQKDILAAAKTYTPTGGRDEYVVFSSGGQSGQVIVYGIPSMRILKYIAVFTPEPWQGYGFDEESKAVLAQGRINGKDINFGDTHHPAISETKGEYDGQYLFINDKANPRMAVIDLHDFETKQIVVNPILSKQANSLKPQNLRLFNEQSGMTTENINCMFISNMCWHLIIKNLNIINSFKSEINSIGKAANNFLVRINVDEEVPIHFIYNQLLMNRPLISFFL